MPQKLAKRKSQLQFETTDVVWHRGKARAVIMEVDRRGAGGYVRLERSKIRYPFSFAGLYNQAVKNSVARERLEKARAKLAEKRQSPKGAR